MLIIFKKKKEKPQRMKKKTTKKKERTMYYIEHKASLINGYKLTIIVHISCSRRR